MSLKTLLQSLRQIPIDQLRKSGKEIAEQSFSFPAGWGELSTYISHLPFLRTKKPKMSDCTLWVHNTSHVPFERMPHIIRLLLEKIHGINHSFLRSLFSGFLFHTAHVRVTWTKDAFFRENNFDNVPYIFFQESYGIKNTNSDLLEFQEEERFIFSVSLDGKEMRIRATGKYCNMIPDIIRSIQPEMFELRLSVEDFELWLAKSDLETKRKLVYFFKRSEESLQGIIRSAIEQQIYDADNQNGLKANLPIEYLVLCTEALGKSPVNEVHGEVTALISLSKRFHTRGDAVSVLKRLLAKLDQFKVDLVFDTPLLTPVEGKVRLEEEIRHVLKACGDVMYFGGNGHIFHSNLIRRLVVEHFGEKVLDGYDDMTKEQWLAWLIEKGYVYKPEDIKDPFAKYFTNPQPIPENYFKDQYLFYFFLQSYNRNSEHSVEQYCARYMNSSPKLYIGGQVNANITKISKLQFPENAELISFKIEKFFTIEDNRVLEISSIQNNGALISVTASLGNETPILELQQMTCELLGITIK